MPIISQIGRRDPRVRLFITAVYALLVTGAAAMVYPFLLMVSGSTKSAVDARSLALVPQYLVDDLALYRKHIEGLFNESVEAMNIAYDTDFASFEHVVPPGQVRGGLVDLWREFLAKEPLPDYASTLGYLQAGVSKTVPKHLREFKALMAARFDDDIDAFNEAMGMDFAGWNTFFILPGNTLNRRNVPADTPFARELAAFAAAQPEGLRYWFSVDGFYKRLFLKAQYTRDIAAYNAAHGTSHRSYDDVTLSPSAPGEARRDWETFVRQTLSLLWLRAEPAALGPYRDYLRARYRDVAQLNALYGTAYRSFDDVPLVGEPPRSGVLLSDWDAFVSGWTDPADARLYQLPLDLIRIAGVDERFRGFLRAKFQDIDALNQAAGTAFARFEEIRPPQWDLHYERFLAMRKELRGEFTTRNYKAVLDYMLLHGRGIANTVIYCTLAVVLALLVNPLAAYAMSRYRMPATYKILMFLMLTMAFPPMVTQIPVFLMLREFGLLNTFAALLLPGLANGYSIFLLKGFFDAQPRDLYESAQLDGAGEWTLFWQITMSLARPILSVVALNAFVAAYSNFMFALLICQDERMWTLMVWLYQLQQRSGPAVLYASLLVAAVPTFIVFMACQRVILRGIVVPVEK
jgi:ABC-type glycerol-3-phosphate transport system permease component